MGKSDGLTALKAIRCTKIGPGTPSQLSTQRPELIIVLRMSQTSMLRMEDCLTMGKKAICGGDEVVVFSTCASELSGKRRWSVLADILPG